MAQLVQTKNRIFETDIWCKSWDKNRQHPFRSFCLINVFKICLHWKSPLYTCALIFSQKQQVQATLAYNSIPVNLDSYQPLGVWQALLGGAHLNGICSTLGIHNGFHNRFGSSTPELLRLTSYQSISWCHGVWTYITILCVNTSSTAQGGGGSFKNRKPIGEIGCCESGMAERSHWWTERCLRSPLFLSLSLTIYLPTNLSSMYLSIYRSISLSLSLFI